MGDLHYTKSEIYTIVDHGGSINWSRLNLCQDWLALFRKVERQREQLGSLLAVIHGDGGHHTDEVGEKQSVEDAHQVWAEQCTEVELLRAELSWIYCHCELRDGDNTHVDSDDVQSAVAAAREESDE